MRRKPPLLMRLRRWMRRLGEPKLSFDGANDSAGSSSDVEEGPASPPFTLRLLSAPMVAESPFSVRRRGESFRLSFNSERSNGRSSSRAPADLSSEEVKAEPVSLCAAVTAQSLQVAYNRLIKDRLALCAVGAEYNATKEWFRSAASADIRQRNELVRADIRYGSIWQLSHRCQLPTKLLVQTKAPRREYTRQGEIELEEAQEKAQRRGYIHGGYGYLKRCLQLDEGGTITASKLSWLKVFYITASRQKRYGVDHFTRLVMYERLLGRQAYFFHRESSRGVVWYLLLEDLGVALGDFVRLSAESRELVFSAHFNHAQRKTIFKNALIATLKFHCYNLIHGDLSDLNLMFNPKTLSIQLIDFDFTMLYGEQRGSRVGNECYISWDAEKDWPRHYGIDYQALKCLLPLLFPHIFYNTKLPSKLEREVGIKPDYEPSDEDVELLKFFELLNGPSKFAEAQQRLWVAEDTHLALLCLCQEHLSVDTLKRGYLLTLYHLLQAKHLLKDDANAYWQRAAPVTEKTALCSLITELRHVMAPLVPVSAASAECEEPPAAASTLRR